MPKSGSCCSVRIIMISSSLPGQSDGLDEDTLRFVNSKIMQLGHRIVKHRGPVDVKADSFVVETDVEHPVDHRLLSEAVGCAVRETGRLCARRNIKGWLQHKHLKAKLGNRSSRLARRRGITQSHQIDHLRYLRRSSTETPIFSSGKITGFGHHSARSSGGSASSAWTKGIGRHIAEMPVMNKKGRRGKADRERDCSVL